MRYARMLLLQSFRCAVAVVVLAWLQTPLHAFTQVQISTAAPVGLEEAFIAATAAQFNAKVTKNPLVSHTYGLVLYGPNPAYRAPPSTLEEALSLGATVYVYGFVDGQAYERHLNLGTIGQYIVNISSSDPSCAAIMGTMSGDIYQQNFADPTMVPPGGF